ncbi:MAG: MFS transporter [Candidatus Heimdallarchaeota archaeon]|nr:MFS transporter [Candidatus Heimdallarchaeota archaeon]
MLSNTFYVLFVLEFVSFTELGILMSIRFITQSVIDYPTGIIADKIGYNRVLGFAYFIHAVSFGFLVFTSTFNGFLIVFLLEAVAVAQESGALDSWFDNQYRTVVTDDQDRQVYGMFHSRNLFVQSVLTGFAIMIGGTVSSIYSRKLIFSIQSVIMILLGISFYFTIKSPKLANQNNDDQLPKIGLLGYMKQGFEVFKSRNNTLLILGLILMNASGYAWGSLILFPLYFGYSGSDFGAGLIRSMSFVTEAIVVLIVGKFTKSRASRSWLSIFIFFEGLVFFGSFAILLHLVPFTYNFEVSTVAIILALFIVADFIGLGAHLIRKKIFVDLVPDHIRNSFYSLEATLIVLLASPLMIVVGYIIDKHGFSQAVAFLGVFPMIGGILIFFGRKG